MNLSIKRVQEVFQTILSHHDGLRLQVDPSLLEGEILSTDQISTLFSIIEAENVSNSSDSKFLSSFLNEQLKTKKIVEDPMIYLFLVKGTEKYYLIFAIHHLLIDGVSWRILLDDFFTLYQEEHIQINKLPDKTHSLKEWSEKLNQRIPKEEELSFKKKINQFVADHPFEEIEKQVNWRFENISHATFKLTKEETNFLLKRTPNTKYFEITDILLASFYLALKNSESMSSVKILMETHGRRKEIQNLELERTIGWLTAMFPICLTNQSSDLITLIHYVRKVIIDSEKVAGSYLNDFDSDTLFIGFNYLGDFSNYENNSTRLESIKLGETEENFANTNILGANYIFKFLLNIEGLIIDNQLQMTISYNKEIISDEKIQNVVNIYHRILSSLNESLKEYKLYPTTIEQKRIFMAQKLHSESAEYNLLMTMRTKNSLNPLQVKIVVEQLIQKFPILQVSLSMENENILQYLTKKEQAFKLYYAQESELSEMIRMIDTPKRMDQDELFSVHLIMTEEWSWLIFSVHHVIVDGISLSILIREFFDLLYGETTINGSYSFLEYAIDQVVLERYDWGLEEELFWEAEIESMLPYIESTKRPVLGKDYTKELVFHFSEEITSLINDRIKRMKCTRQVFFLAVFYWTLYLVNQKETIIGIPHSGREDTQKQNMIGMFVNVLPVFVKVEADMTIEDCIYLVSKKVNKLIENSTYDLENLEKKQTIKRIPSQNIFSYALNYHDISTQSNSLNKKGYELIEYRENAAKFPVEMDIIFDKNYSYSILYLSNVIGDEEAKKVFDQFRTVLYDLLRQ